MADPAMSVLTRDLANRPTVRRVANLATGQWELTILATLVAFRINATPAFNLDPSWKLGLSMAHREGIQHGSDILFTYGPLGPLAEPTTLVPLFLGGAFVFQILTTLALFRALVRLSAGHFSRWQQTAVIICVCLMMSSVPVPERAVAAVALWCVLLRRDATREPARWPSMARARIPNWVFVVAGAVVSVQVLVKFGTGMIVGLVAVVFALSSHRPVRNLALVGGTSAGTFAWLWSLTGQDISGVDEWVSAGLDLSSNYQADMSITPTLHTFVVMFTPVFVLLLAQVTGAVGWVRERADTDLPSLVILAIVSWFAVKQGTVRFDGHVRITYAIGASLLLAIPWRRSSRLLPVVGIGVALLGLVVSYAPLEPGDGIALAIRSRRGAVTTSIDAAKALLSPDSRLSQTEAARSRILEESELDPRGDVVRSLQDTTVHALPWHISTVWASGLDWKPLPVIQSYAAYSPDLDGRNAAALSSPDGPGGILLAANGDPFGSESSSPTIDSRVPFWESPEMQVALVCNFDVRAADGRWAALLRRANRCGPTREMSTVHVDPGDEVTVPKPRSPGSLVVARFELPDDRLASVAATLWRPTRTWRVEFAGRRWRLVQGTAGQQHLLTVPDIDEPGSILHRGLEVQTLAFLGADGSVTVTFEEIPLLR